MLKQTERVIENYKEKIVKLKEEERYLERLIGELITMPEAENPCYYCGREANFICKYGCDGHDPGTYMCSSGAGCTQEHFFHMQNVIREGKSYCYTCM